MAAVAAGPVFRLLGARDLGTSDDYHKEIMHPVNVGILEGQLAWRQHDGGHTDGPNWKYFIAWVDKFFGRSDGATRVAGDQPASRTIRNFLLAHSQLPEKTKNGAASTSIFTVVPSRAAAEPTSLALSRSTSPARLRRDTASGF